MPSSSERVAPAAAHAFVGDLEEPILNEDDRHHLITVMRLRPGQAVTVSDGRGGWRMCRVEGDKIVADGEIQSIAQEAPLITVAFSLTKGAKPEWAVQKLTEIGVDVIQPMISERSIVRWDERKAEAHVARWCLVAKMAAMQSRRVRIPRVETVRDFRSVAVLPGVCLADAGGQPPSLETPTVLVGPEGGWSESERSSVPRPVDLGSTILRAETAALVAGIRLCALRAR